MRPLAITSVGLLLALALPAQAAEPTGADAPSETSDVRVDPIVSGTIDATATYGIGTYSALGAQLHGVAHVTAWKTRPVRGTLDFGLLFGAQDEPQALQYEIPEGRQNDLQRLNAWATVGHTFFLGTGRRSLLGTHLFAGWTHVFSQARIDRPDLDLHREMSDDYGCFNVGAILKYDYLITDWFGLDVQAVGPFPVQPSYVTTLFHVGVGVTFAPR